MFATLGFYPVNPCGGEYILGAPQLNEATIHLQNGKKFTMKANNLSKENYIVQSVSLNGAAVERNYITHDEIVAGGDLVFEMGAEPNRK
jgi:putative alpha-1,2-mannosidase